MVDSTGPDAPRSTDSEDLPPKPASEIQFDCIGCGAPLRFAPGTTTLACPYCGSDQEIEKDAEAEESVREFDFYQAILDHPSGGTLLDGGHEIRCEDCGARAVLQGQAGRCPYCDAPVVVEVETSPDRLVPDSVLPFAIDEDGATQAFERWVKGLWFAPNDLGKRARRQDIDGVYLPYWTYDSLTTNHYRGQRGEYYYETDWYTDSDGKRRSRQVQKTRWYPASGTVRVAFDDVLVYASETLPRGLVEKLEPWDLEALEVFDPAYLSGFIAERYAIELEPGFTLAETRMKPTIRQAVCRDIGGDTQRIRSLEILHDDVTFKHCLLPLWISSFRYDEKVYRFLVNARTGEATGERPYSAWKIFFAVLTALLLVLVIVYMR